MTEKTKTEQEVRPCVRKRIRINIEMTIEIDDCDQDKKVLEIVPEEVPKASTPAVTHPEVNEADGVEAFKKDAADLKNWDPYKSNTKEDEL